MLLSLFHNSLRCWRPGKQEESLSQEYVEQLPVRSPGQHFLYRLTQQDDRGAVEKAFLLTLENPRDGLVDTYLNRSCSRLLTRLFLRTPLTPNQITILLISDRIAGRKLLPAWQLWRVGAWGRSCFSSQPVLDCVDGEVARVKMLESPLGEWLDISLDTVVHIAIFLGVGGGGLETGWTGRCSAARRPAGCGSVHLLPNGDTS